jgi:nucleotide-binding universal stress UspA family protein
MILVGTDLSVASEPALLAAAAVARKQEKDLLVATVVKPQDAAAHMMADVRLEHDAAQLSRDFDITVETVVLEGAPDRRLHELAKDRGVSLIVVGAEGASKRARRLGSVPEHLCQRAQAPVLIARNADGFVAWSRGKQQLRVLVGTGLGDTSKSALASVGSWPDLTLTVAHVAWPYGEHYRLGTSGPIPLDHLRPEVHQQVLGDLGRWASEVRCRTSPRLRVAPGWGRIDSHLAELAAEKEADLLVVGSHQRNLSERIWHGSVSRNAIHEARCNVLCVPQRPLHTVSSAPRAVVAPTDFSLLGDRAINVAYALLPRGGCVHLVFVTKDRQSVDEAALLAQLAARIPPDAKAQGIASELHVLEGDAPWLAIWQYAGRASADLICMASHSRDTLASAVLGSQAQAILQHSRIPVLLVPPDRES